MSLLNKNESLYNAFESEFAKNGKFKKIPRQDPRFRSLRFRYERSDAKQSEAIARSLPENDLELLKALLVRGTFDECATLFLKLQNQSIEDSQLNIEVLTQEARFEYLRGEWEKSIQICNILEKHTDTPALTKTVIYQIRSNAYFELGMYSESFSDIKKLESFESLFPHGQVPLYAHANRVRLEARLYGVEKAKLSLMKLWENSLLKFQSKNLDPVLTLLRSQIDLKRISSSDFSKEALACYMISKSMGDELYSSLALFDLRLTHFWNSRLHDSELMDACNAHPRVKKLFDDVILSKDRAGFQSARDMKNYLSQRQDFSLNSADLHSYSKIFLLNLSLIVDTSIGHQEKLEIQPRSLSILKALSDGCISKAELFTKIWGLKNYSIEKHDSVIRTAISRVREQTGLLIECEGQEVKLDPSVLIIYT